jgi:hypothetical protein
MVVSLSLVENKPLVHPFSPASTLEADKRGFVDVARNGCRPPTFLSLHYKEIVD